MPFESVAAWEAWLEANHADAPGVWLQIAKQASGIPTVTYSEALDAALCLGWIDGQKASYDEASFLQRFTPRRARGKWSKINVDRVARLIEAGRMRPAGLAHVDAAKADGRWEAAYGGSATITVPEDLQTALDANPAARDFFATISRTNRYSVLYRVHDAMRPETRANRIAALVEMLAEGKTFH
ncbi:MAG: YdeI/OmpD-associated family protein [Actinomycetota bacterium]|nr:YdeI/OmpD-associated family protein [Actinomycetota bacterium]